MCFSPLLFSLPSHLHLQESVALTLKQPALIGLSPAELRERLTGLAEAVGCDRQAAARLAAASSTLLMLHPRYVEVGVGQAG